MHMILLGFHLKFFAVLFEIAMIASRKEGQDWIP